MTILSTFNHGYAIVDSVQAGLGAYVNTKLFNTVEHPKAAAVYAASSTMLVRTIRHCTVFTTSRIALAYFLPQIQKEHESDPSSYLIVAMKEAVVERHYKAIGAIIAIPIAFVISTMAGRYLANKVNEGRPFTYMDVIVLDLIYLAEGFLFEVAKERSL